MEIKLNSNLIKDTDICIDIKKVGQEFCAPNKSPTNCVRPCYALHFVLFGRGTLVDKTGKTYDITKNNAFLLYAKEEYKYFPDRSDPWSYIWVEFSGAGLDELLSLCGFEKDNVVKHVRDFNEFIMLMRNMYESYDASETEQLRCSAYFMLVLGKFIDQEQAIKLPPKATKNKKLLRDILIYLNNNWVSDLTSEMITKLFGLSIRSYNRFFAEMLSMSPVEYINSYRISVACERIQKSDSSIEEVAHIAGFQDVAYFSRVFKSIKDISPQEYKKRKISEDPFLWLKEKGMFFR